MSRTRVKMCGFTRAEDVAAACELGVDAIGLNFVGGPRQVSLKVARDVIEPLASIPMPPTVVALCGSVDGDLRKHLTAGEIGQALRVTCYQVYGRSQAMLLNDDDAPSPFWLVRSLATRDSIPEFVAELAIDRLQPQALLLDTASKDKLGGTGQTFDWNWIAEAREAGELRELPPLILAGGLTPDNVADAIRVARPYAVDVASGVEVVGKPGVKDRIKMRDFLQAVRGADGV